MTPRPSPLQLATTVLAHELRDHELYVVGGASPVPLAAGLLAQATHAPNLTVLTGSGGVNPRPPKLPASGGDGSLLWHAEAVVSIEDIFDYTESGAIDVGCFGGIEIDQYGNFNLDGTATFRGPGLVNAGIPMTLGRVLLFVPKPSSRNLVISVFRPSGLGTRWPDGSPITHRRGGGPELLLTPEAAFRFDASGRAVLAALAPGRTVDEIKPTTGFDVRAEARLGTLATPSAEELAFLEGIDGDRLLA